MYREELESAMAASGLTLNVDGPPHAIDDPTYEIRRLHYEVILAKTVYGRSIDHTVRSYEGGSVLSNS